MQCIKCMFQSQPVGWPTKHHTKKCLSHKNKQVDHMTFAQRPTVSWAIRIKLIQAM